MVIMGDLQLQNGFRQSLSIVKGKNKEPIKMVKQEDNVKVRYKKNNADKKISFKYFLNTNLKPYDYPDGNGGFNKAYHVYLRISLKSQTTQMPSSALLPWSYDFFSKEEFETFLKEGQNEAINQEIEDLKWIIEKIKPFEREDFLIKELTEIYKILNNSVCGFVDTMLASELFRLDGFITHSEKPHIGYNYWSLTGQPAIRQIIIDEEQKPFNSLQMLDEYKSDIWGLFAYEHLFFSRRKVANKLSYGNSAGGMRAFVKGEYQKEMVKEFGESTMQPIFNDMMKLFKKNMKHYNLLFD